MLFIQALKLIIVPLNFGNKTTNFVIFSRTFKNYNHVGRFRFVEDILERSFLILNGSNPKIHFFFQFTFNAKHVLNILNTICMKII